MSDEARILDGIKVLDVGTFVFGPAATTVMSDFGADVIKVENPASGDPYRYFHTLPLLPESEEDYCFAVDGRNKRSICLDLSKAEGREVLYALVREADVFETNYHPSVIEKLGLGWPKLGSLNERLIYAQASGYGEAGAEVEKPGYDATAWWARSGLMDLVRQYGSEPALSMPAMGDRPSAMTLFGAIMLALYRRETTGRGLRVSTSLMANGAWANACLIQAALFGADPFEPVPRLETPNPFANIYPTRDDRWIFLAVLLPERDWNGLLAALDRRDLGDDPRFETLDGRYAHAQELAREFEAAFRSRDLSDWRQRLDREDVTFGIVARTEEVPEDDQMLANDVLIDGVDRDGGTFRTINSPIWIEGETKVKPRRAPTLGEHTEDVLAELGYDEAAIERLRSCGAIPE